MNKPHAAAYRMPFSTPAIQAAVLHTLAWQTIAGSTRTQASPRAAWKASSSLTSGSTLPPLGPTQIAPRAQIPLQREPDRIHPPRATKADTPVATAPPRTVVAGIDPTTASSGDTNEKTAGVQVRPAQPDHDGDKPPRIAQTPMQREPVSTLRNGNPRGNPNAAPRCGAKTRAGCPCRGPAMKNGRCRMHGGASTGPSAEGRARIAAARTTHGGRTAAMRAVGRQLAAMNRRGKVMTAMVQAGMRVEDLAAPIRQCRTTPRSGPPLPRKASAAVRDRCFVLRELTAMDFTPSEVRSLLTAIGPGAKALPRRKAAQIPMQREAAPRPPRRPLTCQPARLRLPCRRLDPGNPFPARANPHATWNRTETAAPAGRAPLSHRSARRVALDFVKYGLAPGIAAASGLTAIREIANAFAGEVVRSKPAHDTA